MAEQTTIETFARCLNGMFTVHVDESTSLTVELIEVSPLPVHAPSRGPEQLRRAPFSLVFRGPKNPLLPQRIYRFEHESLGDLDIFIVPIGPDEEGLLYEAVFN